MSRPARIVAELEAVRSVSVENLAASLHVSKRTVVNEVAALQEVLGNAASVVLNSGRYRLVVADPAQYRVAKARLSVVDASFNDPSVRVGHIIVALYRALVPVRTEELARQMAVGRTTVIADLVRVRELVGRADLVVDGRPNVGLTLEGPELQQRLFVLRHLFTEAYPDDNQRRRVQEVTEEVLAEAGLDGRNAAEITRWVVVAMDRNRLGCAIDYLPSRYAGIRATPAYHFASALAARLSQKYGVTLGGDDLIFLALPVVGMRAPDDKSAAQAFNQTNQADALVRDVLAAVRSQMEINLEGREFLEEFSRHLSYMINRMQYRIWVDDSGVANIGTEFPVAHRMATLASRVIEQQVGLPVDPSEVGFLAAYFQVFLEAPHMHAPSFLRVAVVATTGRVAAELVRLQLAKLLPRSTQLRVMSPEEVATHSLDDVDLVVVTGDEDFECQRPVLHVTRVLDRPALERQLARLQLRLPLRENGGGPSVLAGALDEAHFFAMPAGTDYTAAVDFMTGHLEARGLVESGFGSHIRQRESQAQMQLDPWVGFPHATLEHQTSVMLAIGVVPRDIAEEGVRLVVLLGVPADPGLSEGVLVQVYDEVLRLGSRRDLLNQISRVTTFEDFYYFMENNPSTERER